MTSHKIYDLNLSEQASLKTTTVRSRRQQQCDTREQEHEF